MLKLEKMMKQELLCFTPNTGSLRGCLSCLRLGEAQLPLPAVIRAARQYPNEVKDERRAAVRAAGTAPAGSASPHRSRSMWL